MIDIRTAHLVMGVVVVALCVNMVYYSLHRKTYPGFHTWTAALVSGAIGSFLLSLREVISPLFSIVLGNIVMLGMPMLVARGMAIFTGVKHPNWLDVGVVLGMVVTVIYLTYYLPRPEIRIALYSFMAALYIVRVAVLVVRKVPKAIGSQSKMLVYIFSFLSALLLARGIHALFFEAGLSDYMAAGVIQGAGLLVLCFCIVLAVNGLINLNVQRLEMDFSQAQSEIETLQGFLPICSHCKKIRDDAGYWNQVEVYLKEHSGMELTHGICPDCIKEFYPDMADKVLDKLNQ